VLAIFNYKDKIIYTGTLLDGNLSSMEKLPRQLRSKHYNNIIFEHVDKIIPTEGYVPVCIEVDGTIELSNFHHPDKAMYIFGPEYGSVPSHIKRFCHYIVKIQTYGCLNLSHAVSIVLYDRNTKINNRE
jgi:tRNA(Leu) C34 or U34 (ribose-2'-O)-methylase TrmL